MANLNLGQDVANNREGKYTVAHKVAKSYPLYQIVGLCRYGSLIKINPSEYYHSIILPSPSFLLNSFYAFLNTGELLLRIAEIQDGFIIFTPAVQAG